MLMQITKLIHKYELEAQHIKDDMPEHERRGSGPYYRHKLYMIEDFLEALKSVSVMEDDPEWHDADDPPLNNDYIILHFANCAVPMVGRYEGNEEDGGNYYIGDDDDATLKNHLYVDGWTALPVYSK